MEKVRGEGMSSNFNLESPIHWKVLVRLLVCMGYIQSKDRPILG